MVGVELDGEVVWLTWRLIEASVVARKMMSMEFLTRRHQQEDLLSFLDLELMASNLDELAVLLFLLTILLKLRTN